MADEDGGSSARRDVGGDGQYALSPDGSTLALTRAGSLALYDVATGELAYSGVAEAVQPVWLPDSSAVMFMRVAADGVAQIYRVSPSGGEQLVVGAGSSAAVSPNGATIVAASHARIHGDAAGAGVEERGGVRGGLGVGGRPDRDRAEQQPALRLDDLDQPGAA